MLNDHECTSMSAPALNLCTAFKQQCTACKHLRAAALQVPTKVDPLGRAVLMAILNEFDILGIQIPRSRKLYAASLDSQ